MRVSSINQVQVKPELNQKKNPAFTAATIVPVFKNSWKRGCGDEFLKTMENIIEKINKELQSEPENRLNQFLQKKGNPNKKIKLIFKDEGIANAYYEYKSNYIAKARKQQGILRPYREINVRPQYETASTETKKYYYEEIKNFVTNNLLK